MPLADYYDDYDLFTWTQIDDHDAREVLTANYLRHPQRLQPDRLHQGAVGADSGGRRRAPRRQHDHRLVAGVLRDVHRAAAQRRRAGLPRRTSASTSPSKKASTRFPASRRTTTQKGVSRAALHRSATPRSTRSATRFATTTGSPAGAASSPSTCRCGWSRCRRSARTSFLAQVPEQGYVLGQPVNNLQEWAADRGQQRPVRQGHRARLLEAAPGRAADARAERRVRPSSGSASRR